VTARDFRRIALRLPSAVEGAHMNHADFRVEKKIFATLSPDELWGVVMLTPEQQATFTDMAPKTFVPAAGAWGRRGCTRVLLKAVKRDALEAAMELAWANKAPKKLVAGK
jgi:hypothetical protein